MLDSAVAKTQLGLGRKVVILEDLKKELAKYKVPTGNVVKVYKDIVKEFPQDSGEIFYEEVEHEGFYGVNLDLFFYHELEQHLEKLHSHTKEQLQLNLALSDLRLYAKVELDKLFLVYDNDLDANTFVPSYLLDECPHLDLATLKASRKTVIYEGNEVKLYKLGAILNQLESNLASLLYEKYIPEELQKDMYHPSQVYLDVPQHYVEAWGKETREVTRYLMKHTGFYCLLDTLDTSDY